MTNPHGDLDIICHRCGYMFRKGDHFNDIINGMLTPGFGECLNRSACDRRVTSRKHIYNLVSRTTAAVIASKDIDAMMAEIGRQLDEERRQFIEHIMADADTFVRAYKLAANHDKLMYNRRGY